MGAEVLVVCIVTGFCGVIGLLFLYGSWLSSMMDGCALNLVKRKANGMANTIAISSWYKSKDSAMVLIDGNQQGHVETAWRSVI